MKDTLLKKRHGIPAALLVVLLLASTALAWYCFATISSPTTVQESLLATETQEFDATMYPGETNVWTFAITNSAPVAYVIKADLTFSEPGGVSITDFTVNGVDETIDLKGDGSAKFNIAASGTDSCSMTIKAANDATPGDVSVSLALSRA